MYAVMEVYICLCNCASYIRLMNLLNTFAHVGELKNKIVCIFVVVVFKELHLYCILYLGTVITKTCPCNKHICFKL